MISDFNLVQVFENWFEEEEGDDVFIFFIVGEEINSGIEELDFGDLFEGEFIVIQGEGFGLLFFGEEDLLVCMILDFNFLEVELDVFFIDEDVFIMAIDFFESFSWLEIDQMMEVDFLVFIFEINVFVYQIVGGLDDNDLVELQDLLGVGDVEFVIINFGLYFFVGVDWVILLINEVLFFVAIDDLDGLINVFVLDEEFFFIELEILIDILVLKFFVIISYFFCLLVVMEEDEDEFKDLEVLLE